MDHSPPFIQCRTSGRLKEKPVGERTCLYQASALFEALQKNLEIPALSSEHNLPPHLLLSHPWWLSTRAWLVQSTEATGWWKHGQRHSVTGKKPDRSHFWLTLPKPVCQKERTFLIQAPNESTGAEAAKEGRLVLVYALQQTICLHPTLSALVILRQRGEN